MRCLRLQALADGAFWAPPFLLSLGTFGQSLMSVEQNYSEALPATMLLLPTPYSIWIP